MINVNLSMRSVWALSLTLASGIHAAAAETATAPAELDRMDGIRSLNLMSIPGSMPTFYSPQSPGSRHASQLERSPHPFTKLDDFESKYDELQQKYPGNYGWYQLALDQRVIEIYAQRGVGYLQAVKDSFPMNTAKLDSAELLDKLEGISPGWKAWAADLEAGKVKAVH
jgi:hypothetical protein